MMDICKSYFDEQPNQCNFVKNKTKCIVFGSNEVPAPIRIFDENIAWEDSKALPWVESWPHLGHLLHQDESLDHDLLQKRGRFIGKIHSLRQEFGQKDPIVYMKLVSVFLTSFYGSNLWDLFGDSAERLYSSWNIMVRYCYDIPRTSHITYLVPLILK